MIRKIIVFLLAVSILGMCGGCLRKKVGVRVVDRISVQWEENGTVMEQTFDDPQKMKLILNKVRTLGQRFSSDTDPDTLNVQTVTMTLLYSDGARQEYQIKPDRYVRIGKAPWQQADPRQVTALRLLLQSLPGDSKT